MSKNFPVPYTSTTYMCILGSIQCVFIALCFDHSASAWSLHDAMRLASSLHSGVICTGISFPIISWTIGTAIGSLLIVGGLYVFLWGKSKEVDSNKVDDDEAAVMPLPPIKKDEVNKNDMELQYYMQSNGINNQFPKP